MHDESSITQWIAGLKAGDSQAAEQLWNRYFQRLLNLARTQLGVIAHGGADEQDVAQSVFKSLCLGAERGKFPQLSDRDNLWTLLVAMTLFKSRDLIRRQRRLKRGGGRVLDEAALIAGDEAVATIDELVDHEPSPQFAAQFIEQCQAMLTRLTDAERQTAELKLQSFTNREIADRMDCGLRTVERRLRAIRQIWSDPSDRRWQNNGAKSTSL